MSNRVICGRNAEQTKKYFIMNAELNIFGILKYSKYFGRVFVHIYLQYISEVSI